MPPGLGLPTGPSLRGTLAHCAARHTGPVCGARAGTGPRAGLGACCEANSLANSCWNGAGRRARYSPPAGGGPHSIMISGSPESQVPGPAEKLEQLPLLFPLPRA